MPPSIARTVLENSATLTATTVVSKFSYYAFFILVARYLGPAPLGQLTFALVIATASTKLTGLGLDVNLNKRIARDPSDARATIETSQAIRLLASLLGFPLTVVFLLLFPFSSGEHHGVIYIILLRQTLESFRDLYVAVIQAYQRMFYQAIVVIPLDLFTLCCSYFYLQSHHPTLPGVALILLVFSALKVACLITVISRRLTAFRFSLRGQSALDVVSDSWPIGAGMFLAFLMGRADILLLKVFTTEAQVGYYQAAYTLMDAVVILFGNVRASLFPNLSYFYKYDRPRFFRTHRLANIVFFLAAFSAGCAFFFAGRSLVHLIFGSGFDETAKVLRIFSLGVVFSSLSAFLGNSMIAMDKHRQLMVLTGIGCLTTVCLNLLLIPKYGIYGSAWANISTYSLQFVMMAFLVKSARTAFSTCTAPTK